MEIGYSEKQDRQKQTPNTNTEENWVKYQCNIFLNTWELITYSYIIITCYTQIYSISNQIQYKKIQY